MMKTLVAHCDAMCCFSGVFFISNRQTFSSKLRVFKVVKLPFQKGNSVESAQMIRLRPFKTVSSLHARRLSDTQTATRDVL